MSELYEYFPVIFALIVAGLICLMAYDRSNGRV
jgi:hypothetical protein